MCVCVCLCVGMGAWVCGCACMCINSAPCYLPAPCEPVQISLSPTTELPDHYQCQYIPVHASVSHIPTYTANLPVHAAFQIVPAHISLSILCPVCHFILFMPLLQVWLMLKSELMAPAASEGLLGDQLAAKHATAASAAAALQQTIAALGPGVLDAQVLNDVALEDLQQYLGLVNPPWAQGQVEHTAAAEQEAWDLPDRAQKRLACIARIVASVGLEWCFSKQSCMSLPLFFPSSLLCFLPDPFSVVLDFWPLSHFLFSVCFPLVWWWGWFACCRCRLCCFSEIDGLFSLVHPFFVSYKMSEP